MVGVEHLDIYDVTNTVHLGVKSRPDVHRDGDWHRAFHLWIFNSRGVLLQRRALAKDAFGGMLDATAAGHLTAGETVAEGIREVEEELGVTYAIEDLTDLGVHPVEDHPVPGMTNREHQYVYAIADERPLEAYTDFDRVEVDGLVLVSHAAFAALAGGGDAEGQEWDGTSVRDVAIAASELVPASYLTALLSALR